MSLALNFSFKFHLKGAVPERMNFNASCAVFRFHLFLVCQCIALRERCHFMVIKKTELMKRKSMDRRDVILVFPLFFLIFF